VLHEAIRKRKKGERKKNKKVVWKEIREERTKEREERTYRELGDMEKGGGVKGIVPRDFRLQVFFMNQFPQAPEYPMLFSGAWGKTIQEKNL
jgi:hypothetical protein